ncbi:hypothetical protein [Pusillimonas noertemannii]|uniref:Uncharacterized protein n=1 Tax=Pusillimonas noertemannii TaxID=305977 RepID=A0A2U1CMB1_9BURK|nr:hypothetical protein [Pusillimonas noertemannii]NYT68820.1 hypothetical protein [Pusillimonas noertemannii]PVY62156.1 hypothetical protein C7440_1648 [Pusillimonas noertemannii]TFL10855.1 hypothetical protein CSC72_10110 [Pusillimonas noertemannii]
MNAITIQNHVLLANGEQIQELPKLAKDAVVRVWTVPTDYSASGYFVDVQPKGGVPTIPACDSAQTQFVAMLELEASDEAIISQSKGERLAQANQAAERFLALLSKSYPQGEVSSWPQQVKEAEDLINNPTTASTPLIDALAASRSVGREDLATRILQKTEQYAVASGGIIGIRQRVEDLLDAAETHDDVLAVPSFEALFDEQMGA